MQVWRDLAEVPAGTGPSVVTIGNFDGVHRGHVDVLRRMVADAAASGCAAVAVTFTPHPAQVHRPQLAPPLLTGDEDRLELLAATGLDGVLLATYTLDFARQTPEQFVRAYLVDALAARTVVVGRDVRFGKDNAGDLATMTELGERLGFRVDVVDDVRPSAVGDCGGEEDGSAHRWRRWSSTWARELLAAGDVAGAARVLGRPHRIRGLVVRGDARGRRLGYPTANLGPDATGMVPADGVYAGRLVRLRHADGTLVGDDEPDRRLPAAISVGTNPTFDGVQRRVEAYVLDRDDLELYGEEVAVEFAERLRGMTRFDSVDALLATMADDVRRTREVLA
ncbi:MAG TPA: bifunctional riboflavin kinase/FAD synthetase [Cellulomonas sp.]